jgi:HEAT repeat protein
MSALGDTLQDPRPSVRLRAVMDAGTRADPEDLAVLVDRCAVEDDFFVRDMLTWALTRLPADLVVPAVVAELGRREPRARSQALHTLSKVGDARVFDAVCEHLDDIEDEVARAAWRTAVGIAPESERPTLARTLVAQLGRGDEETRLSLSRAFVALGEEIAGPVLAAATQRRDPAVREHAAAAELLLHDPDAASALAVAHARREVALGRTARASG